MTTKPNNPKDAPPPSAGFLFRLQDMAPVILKGPAKLKALLAFVRARKPQ